MNFDLNIDNYSISELIEMFELPSYFDKTIVEMKESKIKEIILNNGGINEETKTNTVNFLTKAKNIILNDKNIILNEKSAPVDDNNILKEKLENFYNTDYELKNSKLETGDEHMIQSRTKQPYISTFPSGFFPGTINPLKKRTIIKNLNVDTRFRENYYISMSTNFNLMLPLRLDNILQLQLSSIELPSSYYVVSKQYENNFFNINVNGEKSTITIPDGNYNETTIMNIINAQLSSVGVPFSYISFMTNLSDFTTGSSQAMVGPNGSGKITELEINFQYDKNGIEDHGTPLPLKLGWNLGFRNGIYSGNVNYVSESVVDLSGPKYLYLVIDDFNNNVNNNFYSAFNSSILNKNILARISLQPNNFNSLQKSLKITTSPREYFGPVNLTSMNIQLLDEYGRIVDLNNMDYSFCLSLTTVYDL